MSLIYSNKLDRKR